MSDTSHTPLHELVVGTSTASAGRIVVTDRDRLLVNARCEVPLSLPDGASPPPTGALVRVGGRATSTGFVAETVDVLHVPSNDSPQPPVDDLRRRQAILRRRTRARRVVHDYFEERDFREVRTPHAVDSPGTDPHVDPVGTRVLGDDERSVAPYLHTSPEFAMKRLLADGCERIYQLTPVWRHGDDTPWHSAEFEMLEWYRAWEGVEPILGDVEQVVTRVLDGQATIASSKDEAGEPQRVPLEPPFERTTMRELVDVACGFDLFEALDYASLREECLRRDLLDGDVDRRHPSDDGRWDELFFELMVTQLEPELAERGAVFVTEWPSELAILARKDPAEPRVAHRFELFVGGVELANGFDELRDPKEQARRFDTDLERRRELGKPTVPRPDHLLRTLDFGLPRSAGVALGFDRLVMLDLGIGSIGQTEPTYWG